MSDEAYWHGKWVQASDSVERLEEHVAAQAALIKRREARIEALEAVLREAREVIIALVDSRWSEVESTGAEEAAFIDAALKQP